MVVINGDFFSPKDQELYHRIRDSLEFITSEKDLSEKRVRHALSRETTIYKYRALNGLNFLTHYPALYIDMRGLLYLSGVPLDPNKERNVEIWMKDVVEGRWLEGLGQLISRVKVHPRRSSPRGSRMRSLKNPAVGMLYPRIDITIERGYKIPRSKFAYKLTTPPEYRKALVLTELANEQMYFVKRSERFLDQEAIIFIMGDTYFVAERLYDLMNKCGLKKKETKEKNLDNVKKILSVSLASIRKYGGKIGEIPYKPSPVNMFKSFKGKDECKITTIGEEYLLICSNCGGDNLIGAEIPDKFACGFCGVEYIIEEDELEIS